MCYGNARDAVEKRRDAALIGDDDWRTGSDGFGGGVAEIFVLGGKNEEVRVAIGRPLGITGKRAGEMNTRRDI